jgi:hypothetical protein
MISKAEAQAAVAALFNNADAATQDAMVTTGGGNGQAPIVLSAPQVVITPIPADRVDGVTVLPNDEQLRLQAGLLPPGTKLKPGDSFSGLADGLSRTVVTAHLDALGVVWTCAVRRVFP